MGLQKRLRQAAKTNHALETGNYYMSAVTINRRRKQGRFLTETPVSAGVLRAKARLEARRKAQEKRLKDAAPALVSRQQLRRADMWSVH